jgi:uncharacterized protein (TIGR03382 family)
LRENNLRAKLTGLAAALTVLLPTLAGAQAIPSAVCRPSGDRPETGTISGATTAAEIAAGAPAAGFKCNADLVGQYQGEGASWQLTAWQKCAYFDQEHPGNPGSADETHPGTVVVDVSDPSTPTPTTWLNSPAMIDPWESVKVNPKRQLLGGGQRPLNASSPADGFSVYDISADCTQPVLKAAVELPGSFGHTGQWAPDGLTYYITPLRASPSIVAVDVTDPTNPAEIPGGLYTFLPTELANSTLHDLEFSKDGNTAYITMFGIPAFGSQNGFAILDVSDFQNRRANPKYRVISQLTWDDGSFGAQNALPITIGGNPYVLVTDEAGAGFIGAAACLQGISANGFARIIDISDPTNPTVVSKIQLGVADPANCVAMSTAPVVATALADGGVSTGPSFFGHSCHYCNVDDVDDAKIAACNCFAAGLRFFDIHDVTSPKEMAYYKAPAQGAKHLPASQYANSNTPTTYVRQYDWATSKVSFPKDRGDTSGDIWTTSQDNGFEVISLYSLVTVAPATATITAGTTTQFTATVAGAAATAGVNWSIEETTGGATVSPVGFVSGLVAGTYHVIATSILDPTKTASSTVTVTNGTTPPPTSSSSSGCSSAPAGASFLLAPLGLLLWSLRRRKQRQ